MAKEINRINIRHLRLAGATLLLSVLFAIQPQDGYSNSSSLGIIRGVVEDKSGKPINGAVVNIFKDGATRVLKQITSDSEGIFSTRMLPGTYSLVAVATGYNSSSPNTVQISRTSEVVYRFNLEPVGSGKTVPEKRRDRSDSKWVIRAAQNRRSIFQLSENETSDVADSNQIGEEAFFGISLSPRESAAQRKVSVVEILGGGSGASGSLNFASLYTLSENHDLLFTGQFSKGPVTNSRLETTFLINPAHHHSLRLTTGLKRISREGANEASRSEFNLRVIDELKIRDDFVLVLGFDYSRLLGEQKSSYLTPRAHAQFDLNSRTRLRTGIYPVDSEELENRPISLDGFPVVFFQPTNNQRLNLSFARAPLHHSSRADFGFERIIDHRSSLEGAVFVDLVSNQIIGLLNIPSNGTALEEIVSVNSSDTSGIRVIYSRTLNSQLNLSGGYSFGFAPSLTRNLVTSPIGSLDRATFHSIFAQLNSNLGHDTYLRTIIRFSSDATVFAVDPFLGKVTVYDPGVSLILTRMLPSLGLPIRAEASIDARNIFDFFSEVATDESTLRAVNGRRMIRGGILVRF